jgi:hypothetical protein
MRPSTPPLLPVTTDRGTCRGHAPRHARGKTYFWQSGRPTASGGRFCAVVPAPDALEPVPLEFDDIVPVEPVLPLFELKALFELVVLLELIFAPAEEPLPVPAVLLGLMLLPVLWLLLVCPLSFRTWLAAASQHFCVLPEDIVLGELVDEVLGELVDEGEV